MTAYIANSPNWPFGLIPRTAGQSLIAEATNRNAKSAEISETQSFSAKSPREKLNTQFLYIINECLSDDWDGHSASAIDHNAILQLLDFYSNYVLILDLPYPEITPEPDGQIALDWHGNSGADFSISFSGKEEFTYVYMDDHSRNRGVFKYDSFDFQIIKRFILKATKN